MMIIKYFSFFLILMGLVWHQSLAASLDDQQQIRSMLADIQHKINQKQFHELIPYTSANTVMTFYDGTTVIGQDKLNQFFNQLAKGPLSIIDSIYIENAITMPVQFYDSNTAIVHSPVYSRIIFKNGEKWEINGAWTASLIKIGPIWQVAALHYSTNMFDNPILKTATHKIAAWIFGVFVFGLLLGYLINQFILHRFR